MTCWGLQIGGMPKASVHPSPIHQLDTLKKYEQKMEPTDVIGPSGVGKPKTTPSSLRFVSSKDSEDQSLVVSIGESLRTPADRCGVIV